MNRALAFAIMLAWSPALLGSQEPEVRLAAMCCDPVEIVANRSEGNRHVPSYLSVWVEPSARHIAFQQHLVLEAREAFGVWTDAGVPILFDFTADSSRATVRVFWRSRFREPLAGRSTWWTASGRFESADIEVALGALQEVTAPLVRAIVMHEIGHLLGFDHVREPDSIMSYHISQPYLSARDRARLRQRFSLPPETH